MPRRMGQILSSRNDGQISEGHRQEKFGERKGDEGICTPSHQYSKIISAPDSPLLYQSHTRSVCMKNAINEKRKTSHTGIRGRVNGLARVKKAQTQTVVCLECGVAAGGLASTGFLVGSRK